ncbi:hypothetical protein VSDG_07111 [Cytospora chrysosperma]|uniref:Zn(2)-C6 fungal-type domain-containing protein n=1 Tax=Cytospora chrysosperma TaxID=252740 RepID=A0A423VUV9_CYTCH|nr:hypothetical protein VSDG_07111 [Valsa sordida]
MAQTTSTSPFQGFSVYQPALGAPLQFLPAVGTKELEQLVDAYLPGPASAPEKRASISMDFFDHYGQTGENFKYYAVYTPVATPESAQSSYSVSPVTSDLGSYSSPSQASTPAAGGAVKKARVAARKPVAKQEKSDFSNLPGMKILTKDGTDVTNSVSRGCKSKEQRDHAHLMRILKACDACKKKKIRCDPSHKKRAASQMDSESKSEAAKSVKKTKKTTSMPLTERTVSKPPPAETHFQMDDIGLSMDFPTPVDESWEQFLTFNDEPAAATIPQDFYGAIPQEFDFFFGAENNNNFSPSASGSSVSPIQPVTPVSSGMVPQVDDFAVFGHDRPLAFLQSEDNSLEPGLPYLNPAGQHGSNYVDFNLFSPSSSFVDEEPKLLKSGGKRSAAASPTQSAGSSNASVSSTGLVSDQDWLFDQSHFTLSPSQSEWLVPDGEVSARQLATVDGERGVYAGSQPYHANDAGQGTIRSMHAVTRSHCPEPMRKNSPVAAVAQKGESLPGVTGLGGSSAATSSAPLVAQTVIPHVSRQNIIPEGTANAHELQALDSRPRRPIRSTTHASLPLSAAMTHAATSPSSGSLSQMSLPLVSPAGGLQGLSNLLEVSSQSRPSQAVVAGNGLDLAAQSLPSSAGSNNVNAALPVHGLGVLSQGLLRPAANTQLRPLEMLLAVGALLSTPPVRQMLASSPLSSQLRLRAKSSGGAIGGSVRSNSSNTAPNCRKSRPFWAGFVGCTSMLS